MSNMDVAVALTIGVVLVCFVALTYSTFGWWGVAVGVPTVLGVAALALWLARP